MSAVQAPPEPTADMAAPEPPAADPPSAAAPAPSAAGPSSAADELTNGKQDPRGPRPGGKDRKPRRERPPLPDPLPEKLVEKYPEPSRTELQKKINVHNTFIDESFAKLAAARQFINDRAKIREAGKGEFEAARKQMNAKNDELKAMFDRRKDYSMQIKQLRDADINARMEASSSGSNKEAGALRGLQTVQEVDARIAELERRQQTESMSILEEKKIVGMISYLKHTGRDIVLGRDAAFKQEKAAKQARIEKRQELETQRKELDKKIDAEKVALNELKKAVDNIRAKQEAEIKKLAEETQSIDRDKVKEGITTAKAAIRTLRDDFSKELDNWYLNERIFAEQIRLQKKKRWEAQQAEREARRKKWEEEQASYPEPDPYQREKDMIAGLTVYLQTLLGETVEKSGSNSLLPKSGNAPSLRSEKNSRTVSRAGKAIGKTQGSLMEQYESCAFSGFMEKKSRGKSKNRRRQVSVSAGGAVSSGADENLKPCPIDLIAAFTHLGITPPNKLSEVRGALDAVKEKKAYYDSNPPPPAPEAEPAKEAKKKPAAKANGKPSVKESLSSGSFPGLNGAGDDNPKVAEDSAPTGSRPSYGAIAKGQAAAPVPAVVPTVYPTVAEAEAETAGTAPTAAEGDADPSPAAPPEAPPAQAVAFTES